MLQRYFYIILVAFLFSACQSENNNGSNVASSESTENNNSEGEATPPIKSMKEAAKEQQLATRRKMKEAKEQEKSELTKRGDLKVEAERTNKVSDNQQVIKGESTKERIQRNLRQSRQITIADGRNNDTPSPSRDFMMGLRSLADIDLRAAKWEEGKPFSSYDSYTKAVPVEEYYAYTSHDRVWGGPFTNDHSEEGKENMLEDVDVFEVVFKSTKLTKGVRPDVKITEIQFKDKASAEAAIPKIEAISRAIFNQPKHINKFWQDDNRFYILETRAASFGDILEEANKVFYFTVTSSK